MLPVRENVPFAERTTLGVGGRARYWLDVPDVETLVAGLGWARARGLPVEVLGRGSNTVAADGTLEALVVRVRLDQLRSDRLGEHVLVEAGAGVEWDALVRWAVSEGHAGIEGLSGIPGDVGAAPVQNIGAYGQELAPHVERVHVVDRITGQASFLAGPACGFGYRDSVFKRDATSRNVIVGVALRLACRRTVKVEHAELRRALGPSPSLGAVRDATLALRRAKSMVLDADDENRRSAGSFFVNPTVDALQLAAVQRRAASALRAGETLPCYAAGDGRTKLAAAWLIERAGLPRGTRCGRVGLSTRHALCIVNVGGASAREVIAFATTIRARVFERFGVSLSPEPRLLGFRPEQIAGLVAPLE